MNNINFKKNDDRIDFENINLSKDYHITDFKKIYLQYLDINEIKNDISIIQNKKNSYLIKGKNFDLNKIINQILFEDTDQSKIFDDKKENFKSIFKEIKLMILNIF